MTEQTNPRSLYYDHFHEVAARLRQEPWYSDEWRVVVAYHGEGNQRNPGFTLSKTDWFDGGIHFESWMGNADVKRSAVPISMHFETSYDKSGIRRGEFYAYLLEEGKAVVEQLADYTFSPKSYQLFINRVPYVEESFIDVMMGEYNKVQAFASFIDATIEAVREK